MIWTSIIAQGKRSLLMSLLVAVLVALIYFPIARFYQGSVAGVILWLGWVPVLLNLLRAGLNLVYRLQRHPFQTLDLGIAGDQVAPGKAFLVEIRSKPRRAETLKRLSLELRCTRQKHMEKGRQTAILHSDETTLVSDRPMDVGREEVYRAELPIPNDAPYSFRSMQGKISWGIYVFVEVEGWGLLEDALEVTVAPG